MKIHADIKIYGKVHGVQFRFNTRVMAERIGVFGYAKNVADGTVEIEAEGEKEDIERLIAWCKKGPEEATVERVEVVFADKLKSFRAFESVRGMQT